MATRQRRSSRSDSDELFDDEFSDVSEEDILAYMAEVEVEMEEEESRAKPEGFLNLQTGAGLGLIGLGSLYTMQLLGFLSSPLLSQLAAVLPWLAGILIVLTGFGVLSWSPAARRRRKARERAVRAARRNRQKTMGRRRRASTDDAGRRARRAFEQAAKASGRVGQRASAAIEASKARSRSMTSGKSRGRRLAKSRKLRKITGVASGIAEHFGVDPTVIRIAFVLGAIFGQGAGILLYIILSFVLPDSDGDDDDDDPVIGRFRRD